MIRRFGVLRVMGVGVLLNLVCIAVALSGVDLDHPGKVISRAGRETLVPRIVGPVKRLHAVETGPLGFLRRNTTRQVKVTVPGPFTMSQLVHDDYYGDPAKMAMALAVCVREEIRDLFAAGADISQFKDRRRNMDDEAEYRRIGAHGREALAALSKPLLAMPLVDTDVRAAVSVTVPMARLLMSV